MQKSMLASSIGCLIPSLLLLLPALGVWGEMGFDEGTGEERWRVGRGNFLYFRDVYDTEWTWWEIISNLHPHFWPWFPLFSDHILLHHDHKETEKVTKQSSASNSFARNGEHEQST